MSAYVQDFFQKESFVANFVSRYEKEEMKLQRDWVLQEARLKPDSTVLDLGCGPGFLMEQVTHQLGSSGKLFGIDMSDRMIELAQHRVAPVFKAEELSFHVGKAQSMPYSDNVFDTIISMQVLEYCPDIGPTLQECGRVLQPGGSMFLLDTDWDTLVVHSTDTALFHRIRDAYKKHFPIPDLPRRLSSIVVSIPGLQITRVLSLPLVKWGSDVQGSWLDTGFIADRAEANGMNAGEVQAWRQDQDQLHMLESSFRSVQRFLFVLTKL